MKNIKKIRLLSWEDVFRFWHENEGKSENWNKMAKERGFSTWAQWRLETYARPLGCETAFWGFYEIKKPAEVVASFFGGPFRTWVENYYNNGKAKKISELITIPEIRKKQGIQEMKNNFPKRNIIICLRHKGEIYVIEGMHRSCALALMHEEKNYSIKKMFFAIGESKIEKLPVVGYNIKK
ncbi:hypothetical protein K8R32_01115 [bacterium]|nr:hypothetical protein [bacterium]